MSKFVLGFALCSSLVSCAIYKVYEAQCEQEAAEQARRKKRRRKKRLEKRNARAGGRALAASPTKRADASALAASVQKPERHHVGSGGLARGTSAAARRTAQLVTDEVRLALGNNYEDWADAFQHMDRNKNGDLTAAEFRRGLKSLTGTRLTPAQLDDLMYEVDQNGDGHVDYLEYIAAFRRTEHARQLAQTVTSELRHSIDVNRESLLRVFDKMDTNKDGLLTTREFQRGLRERGIHVGKREMTQLMRVVDQDGDETLDYQEFMQALERDHIPADGGDSESETWSSTDGDQDGSSSARRRSGRRPWQHSPSTRHRPDGPIPVSRTRSRSPRTGWVGRAARISI